MSGGPALRLAALSATVLMVSLAGAGCMAQDRPEHHPFSIIAQAGHDVVEPAGQSAHFNWSAQQAVEAEGGEAPEVELEFEWTASGEAQPISHGDNATVTRADDGLSLVGLKVTAGSASASDVAAALFTQTPAAGALLYVAAVGPVRMDLTGLSPTRNETVALGESAAQLAVFPATVSATTVDIPLTFDAFAGLGGPVEGGLIVALRAPGVEWTQMTGPSEFEAGEAHVLRVRTGATGDASLVIGEGASQHTTAIEAYGEEHPAEGEGRALVSSAQSLPGFEAAVATLAIAGAGAIAVLSRRRL